MKKQVILFLILILTFKVYAQEIIIKDINIIPMTRAGLIRQQSVLIKSGKIVSIGESRNFLASKGTIIINGKGKYLMPGLADMHVHLPEDKKIEKLLLSNVAAGVTQIRVMNSVEPQIQLRENLSKKTQLISPNIHYSRLVKSNETFTKLQSDSLMKQLKLEKITFIKLLSLSNEQTFENLTKSANQYNITIGGHYPVYQKDGKSVRLDIEKVIASNYKSIEHLGGYVSLQDDKRLESVIQMTKAYDIYNCPTLDWDMTSYNLQYPAEYKNRITYQFLPEKFAQKWETEYATAVQKAGGSEKVIAVRDKYKATFELKLKILKKLYDNNCLLLLGSDPSNNLEADGFNVYEEMVNWSNAGIDNYTILKSATVNPAKFFNEIDQWGTVEVGKNAELIILQKNPLIDIKNITSIETTIIGKKIYQNKTLVNNL